MSSTTSPRTIGVLALLSGAAFAFTGALQVTNEFGGTHNTLDSTAEYLVTGALAVALFLIGPVYRFAGELAGTPRAGLATMMAQLVIGLMCTVSVTQGADPAFFNAVAPVCLLTLLVGSVVLARGLRRTGAAPAAVAYALPALVVVTFPLSVIGGPLLTAAFWLAVGAQLVRAARPAVAAATA